MKRIVLTVFIFILCMILGGCDNEGSQPSVSLRVAIPYSDYVQDPETNYYINWLEERTGYDIEPIVIRQTRAKEYLDTLFDSEASVDVVLFGEDFTIDARTVSEYADRGLVARRGSCDPGDSEYYYPNYGSSVREGCGQVMWINYVWLQKLNLKIPATTDEFTEVLREFKKMDPNGNGLRDELPLIGSLDGYELNPTEFLLNSFIYNDPYNTRVIASDDVLYSAAVTGEFREGLLYCHELYEEELLDERTFTISSGQLAELINSPNDLVGAFTTDSVSELVYQGNPEVLSRFIHVTPLTGPEGEANALYREKEPEVGAIILSSSQYREETEKLLTLMLSEEASLIARYGEEGVDWEYSDGLDVSIYGGTSTITTRNYLWNTSQNKHLNGIGPMWVPEEFLTGVTWNGVNSDTEYIDARARMSYEKYLTMRGSGYSLVDEEAGYIDEWIKNFVTGDADVTDNGMWNHFVQGVSMR